MFCVHLFSIVWLKLIVSLAFTGTLKQNEGMPLTNHDTVFGLGKKMPYWSSISNSTQSGAKLPLKCACAAKFAHQLFVSFVIVVL